ncbi:MAG: helix-turn-helix transcriptional regulator, partial [Actinobacteria bacterium]|nr:helix-turn-helix transcriptional regulator [Actinomycetota bacterium]
MFGHDGADCLCRPSHEGASRTPVPELTEREHDVLALSADGASNAVIARKLGLTAKTVATTCRKSSLSAGVDRAEEVV